MEQIVLARVIHGSHLFGLSTASSDRDYMSVVLPSAERILLGDSFYISDEGTTGDSTRKNTRDDIDDKQFSLGRFLDLCMMGTLDVIEILNAPPEFHVIDPHPLFRQIVDQKHRLACRNFDKIIGFCSSQAITYAPRQERYTAAAAAVAKLQELGITETSKIKTEEITAQVVSACASPHVKMVEIPNGEGRPLDHLDICGKMVASSVYASQALKVARAVEKRYGRRVRDVSDASSHDWKSLSHALRTAYEGIEYMRTGSVTLPVPGRAHLLEVKLGQLPMEQVADEVEEAVALLKDESRKSILPESADADFARELTVSAYGRRVVSDFDSIESGFAVAADLNLSCANSILWKSKPKNS